MNTLSTFFSFIKRVSKPIRNNRGMNTSSMYGIVLFLIGSVGSALTFVVNGAFEVHRDVENRTEYISAVNAVEAAAKSIKFTLHNRYIVTLDDYVWDELNVSIEEIEYGISYKISRPFGDKRVVAFVHNVGGQVFFTNGTTKGKLENESLKTASLLTTLYNKRMGYPNDYFMTFDEVVSDFKAKNHNITAQEFITNGGQTYQNLAVNGTVQITNANNFASLYVGSNAMLVINGDLIIDKNNFTFEGVIVVSGNVIISNGAAFNGAMYVGGYVSSSTAEGSGANSVTVGQMDRPGYLFAQRSITLSNNADLFGYIISDTSVTIGNSSDLTGGVYGFTSEPTVGSNDSQNVEPMEITELDDEIGLIMIHNASLGSGVIMNTRPVIE